LNVVAPTNAKAIVATTIPISNFLNIYMLLETILIRPPILPTEKDRTITILFSFHYRSYILSSLAL
ncbi:MAG: hypothetical protein M3530_06150, partial [Thermoproteota archaeon]|nr:hypothetical protein [Thermoproteota archaeon]